MIYLRKGETMSEYNAENVLVTLNPKIGSQISINGWPILEDHDGSSVNIKSGNATLTIEILNGEFRIRCYDTAYDFKDDLFEMEIVNETDEDETAQKYYKLKLPASGSCTWGHSEDAQDSMDLLQKSNIKVSEYPPLGYCRILKPKERLQK